MNKKKILHIITSTSSGGAEYALYYFLKNRKNPIFEHQVLSLTTAGLVAEKIGKLGIKVDSLNLHKNRVGIKSIMKISQFLRRGEFNLVHCWMYHANLVGGIFSCIFQTPCIWSIHHHSINRKLLKKSTIVIIRIGALISKFIPNTIIYCSPSTQLEHESFGYAKKGVVIPNGFDLMYFKPDDKTGANFRKDLCIHKDTFVFGHAARFHSTKDQKTLINALQKVIYCYPKTLALLCGKNIDSGNAILKDWISHAELRNNIILLGELNDLRAFYNAIDVLVLSSLSEALPNVIGEAMSSGVPCVATDVGDCRYLISNTGLIVPPSSPDLMSEAMVQLLQNSELRNTFGLEARERIKNKFAITSIVKSFEELYMKVISEYE